jgi:DnaJ-class molecular chaperone
MKPWHRPCPACKGTGEKDYTAYTKPCDMCKQTGEVDVVDRLFRTIEASTAGLETNISLSMADAQFLANQIQAMRDTDGS